MQYYLNQHVSTAIKNDVIVLDFDHLNNKRLGIAEMYRNSYSIETVKEEIRKCVVRCANCHRKKTAKEIGYWKFKISKLNN